MLFAAMPFFYSVSAQDTTFTNRRNAIGIEVTGLIPMSFGDLGGPTQYPYFLTYRRAIGPGWARFGVGAYGYSDKSDGDPNSSVIERERGQWWMNVRLGYAIPLINERRWLVLGGVDFLHSRMEFTYRDLWEDNDERKHRASSIGSGLGLAIDAQYRIGKRVAIGTEFNAQAMISKSKEDRTYSLDPEYDSHSTSETTDLGVIRAFSLFLHAYF